MDVDNNKHGREGQDAGDATGDASYKKIKLGNLEKELRDWTLLELFYGLAKLSDEDDLLEIVREVKKRLAVLSGLHILLSDQVRISPVAFRPSCQVDTRAPQVKPFLTEGLSAALPAIRELTLAQLARTASAGPQGFALLVLLASPHSPFITVPTRRELTVPPAWPTSQTEVWPAIVKSVADSDLRVATTAVQTILTVAKEALGQELVFSPTSSSMFNGMIIGTLIHCASPL